MALGVVFATSFLTKSQDVPQFIQTVARFDLLPKRLNKLAAVLFLGSELAVVILLVLGGRFLTIAFALTALLLPLFAIALVSVLARKIQTPCNCFGSSERPVSVYDAWRNVGFTLLAALGLWLLKTANTVETHLTSGELTLIGFISVAFVLLWANLGEIASLLRAT
jgi:hypothetical protein